MPVDLGQWKMSVDPHPDCVLDCSRQPPVHVLSLLTSVSSVPENTTQQCYGKAHERKRTSDLEIGRIPPWHSPHWPLLGSRLRKSTDGLLLQLRVHFVVLCVFTYTEGAVCSISYNQSTGVFSNRVLSNKFRWPTESLYCSGGLANYLRGDFLHLTLEFWTSINPV